MKPDYSLTRLTGWGQTAPSVARTATVSTRDVAEHIKDGSGRGVLMRGLGRSYGDAAQNGGGLVLRLSGSASDAVLDEQGATIRSGGGVSLHDLLEKIVPRGFFIPVSPGTRLVTVGGAIASDIHGKNHHLEGSFGNHVQSISLLLADGTVKNIGPHSDAPLFWATIGGMGLTGVILEATFRLLRIETSRCIVNTVRCNNIDDLMAEMSVGDDDFRYSVAWTDLLASGANLGRSVLWRGDHARRSDLKAKDAINPFLYEPKHLVTVPPLVPSFGVVNRLTSAAFSEIWFHKAPRRRMGEIKTIPAYFHPLDSVGSWNRLYGRNGFLQYQFVVPFDQGDILRQIVERVAASKLASPLVVLKRFGEANPAPLSFPIPGWTMTVDIAAAAPKLSALLHGLDEMVVNAGGRHYLAKDAHTTADIVRRGYPRLEEWKSIRSMIDPDGVWQSDLGRRVQLID